MLANQLPITNYQFPVSFIHLPIYSFTKSNINPGCFVAKFLHVLNVRSRVDVRIAVRTAFTAKLKHA